MDKRKKAYLLLCTYLVLWFTPKKVKATAYNEDYKQLTNPIYATYKSNHIYIIPPEYAEYIDTTSNDIFIVDYRLSDNPVMRIYNSYQIISIKEMLDIIDIINTYESEHPSAWNRTTKTMLKEWLIHNICYYLNIQTDRTKEVDFDNEDEEIYKHSLKVIKEIITSISETDTKTKELTK